MNEGKKDRLRRTARTVLITILAAVALGITAVLLVMFTGTYNVAATETHWPVTRWVFSAVQEESVAARAASVAGAPPADSAALAHGFEHFHAMCVQCHGAPGFDRGEIGKGLSPLPPRLEEEAAEWSDAELFWITRNGIRLTGMPAFGVTHSDEQIWGIVGFVRRLSQMTEQEYAMLVEEVFATPEGADPSQPPGGHTHAPGTPAHSH